MMKKYFRFTRRFMTLLEVLIGMTLTAVLLSTLAYFYQQVQLMGKESERIGKEQFQLRYLGNRLSKVVPSILAEHQIKKNNFIFFTSGDAHGLLAHGNSSLIFIYNNGASLDNQLANHALGRLYLDKSKRLCLATWPTPEGWNWKQESSVSVHKEILMENIESLQFLFYVAPDRDRSLIKDNLNKSDSKDKKEGLDEAVSESERKGEWVSEWPKDYESLPAMMKIIITRSGHKKGTDPAKTTYGYPLPNSQKLIVYEQI